MHLDTSKVFYSPTKSHLIVLKTIKIYIKIALTHFGVVKVESTPEQCNMHTSTRTLPIYAATSPPF